MHTSPQLPHHCHQHIHNLFFCVAVVIVACHHNTLRPSPPTLDLPNPHLLVYISAMFVVFAILHNIIFPSITKATKALKMGK